MPKSKLWTPIQGYEGIYEISSEGDIKRVKTGRILKLCVSTKGYASPQLYKNNRYEPVRTHRLVAVHFIPNPENKPFVNHIDGNKLNNSVTNLEWVTNAENVAHGWNLKHKKLKEKTSLSALFSPSEIKETMSVKQLLETIFQRVK
jgi:hypothetical protein